MDYGTVLSKFSACMTEIGNALRKINGTTKKYKFTEIASAINECTQVYYLGTGTSFDVSNIPDYQNLTEHNFLVTVESAPGVGTGTGSMEYWAAASASGFAVSKNYNASTGKLTVDGISQSIVLNCAGNDAGKQDPKKQTLNIKVYLVKGKIK